jgi:hypothetical protein
VNPTVQLLQFLLLTNFPSGSSINYYQDKLYILGDDARTALVLDRNYRPIDSVLLFDHSQKRIPKSEKVDLESSAIVTIIDHKYLLVLGSGSTEARKKIVLIPLTHDGLIDHAKPPVQNSLQVFYERLAKSGIAELNIEGAYLMDGQMILANRGSKNLPYNFLIATDNNFWSRQKEANLRVMSIEQPIGKGEFLGISELCYVKSKDLLLVMFTTEATSNSYDDGAIGSSYLGWLNNFSTKMLLPKLKLDGITNLSDASHQFNHHKIEGICLEQSEDNGLLLHLISDNDNGQSTLFKILVKFND